MIKLSFKIAPIILAAALISGCASEFMKGTPAYTGKLVYGVAKSGEHVRWNDPKAEKIEELDMSKHLNKLNADRVNVWPLVYYNFPVTSIFWPCAEINDKGWAARPFITANDCDKNYYYMMWLGNIDNKNDSSYFIPLYYKSKDSFVSMFGGWGAESMFIVPPLFAVTDKDKDPSYHVLFPFSKYTPSDNSSYVFPLYGKSDGYFISMLGGWGKESMAIVPPLFVMTDRNRQPAYHIMFPFGKYDTATGTHYALPLYYKSKDLFFCTLGGWSDRNMVIAPPLFAMTKRDEQPVYHIMFPFGKYDTATRTHYALPLYYSDKERFYTMLTGWEKNKFFYAGGPLLWMNTEKENVYNIMWPLARLCPEKSEYRFLPLMDYKSVPGEYDFTYLLLLGQIWKNDNSHGSYFFPLYQYKEDKDSKFDSLITPLFGSYDKGKSFYVLPPFYFFNRKKDYSDSHIMFPFGKLRVMHNPTENIPEYQGYVFPFYGRYKDDLDDSRWVMWPFFHYSEKYSMKDTRSQEEKKLKESKPRLERSFEKETVLSLPFYFYKRTPDSLQRSYFILAGSKRQKIAATERDSYYALPLYMNAWKEKKESIPDEKDKKKSITNVYSENIKWYSLLFIAKEIPEKNESGEVVLPFLYVHNKSPEKESHFVFPGLYTREENFEDKSIVSQAMWAMLFYYKNKDGNTYRNYGMFTGNTHEKIAGKERDSFYILPFYMNMWEEITETSKWEKSDMKESDVPKYSRNLKYYFPFVATTEYPEKNEFNFTVLPFFYFYSRTPEEKSNSAFFWLFSRYEDFREKSIMSQAMWFLFYYKDQQKTETEEAFTSFRVFGKLYHREESEGKVNVDVFPFIKYSEEGKENRFSFAWRFFNVKNDENGLKRLDIFFIPFYRKAEKNK